MSGSAQAEDRARWIPATGEPWTVMALIRWSAAYLSERGVPSARLDAEHLLADVLALDRLQLYMQFDRPLAPSELAAYKSLLLRRASREPVQYILGRTAFRELELATDPRALIPRPETEQLVDIVLEHAGSAEQGLTALDVGTGTGAIALSLLREGPFDRVVATDTSSEALALARDNARRAGLEGRVELRLGESWEPIRKGERFDVVVSNPPYVAISEMADLAPEIAAWEPRAALAAGTDGLDTVRKLIAGAAERLAPGGLLAIEIGSTQGPRSVELCMAVESLAGVAIRRDLAGKDRFLVARLRSGAAGSAPPAGAGSTERGNTGTMGRQNP